jgi:hypothetical protein
MATRSEDGNESTRTANGRLIAPDLLFERRIALKNPRTPQSWLGPLFTLPHPD